MDITTLIAAICSSIGVSAATAAWLTRSLIGHRLKKDLELFKSDLDRERAKEKASFDGEVRQQIETVLGELAAERQYVLDARKRLYTVIGPLRFQLLMACRDLAGRVRAGATRTYDMRISGYYGRSSLYRILRPLCLSELIERQIAYADFSVDTDAIDLLKFKKGAFAVFSGGSVVEKHPKIDWKNQCEHVFYDYLSRCANMLICQEGNGQERVMRFNEFEELLRENCAGDILAPFPKIFEGFTPQSKPLFWVRLVAYGYLCNHFINNVGSCIGFEVREYPVSKLLVATEDPVVCDQISEYVRRCEAVPVSPL